VCGHVFYPWMPKLPCRVLPALACRAKGFRPWIDISVREAGPPHLPMHQVQYVQYAVPVQYCTSETEISFIIDGPSLRPPRRDSRLDMYEFASGYIAGHARVPPIHGIVGRYRHSGLPRGRTHVVPGGRRDFPWLARRQTRCTSPAECARSATQGGDISKGTEGWGRRLQANSAPPVQTRSAKGVVSKRCSPGSYLEVPPVAVGLDRPDRWGDWVPVRLLQINQESRLLRDNLRRGCWRSEISPPVDGRPPCLLVRCGSASLENSKFLPWGTSMPSGIGEASWATR
jgi:hypothetical protein